MSFQETVLSYAKALVEGEQPSHPWVFLFENLTVSSLGQCICSFLEGLQAMYLHAHPCLGGLHERFSQSDQIWEQVQQCFFEQILAGKHPVPSDIPSLEHALMGLFVEMFPQNGIAVGDVPVETLALSLKAVLPRDTFWKNPVLELSVFDLVQKSGLDLSLHFTLNEDRINRLSRFLESEFGLSLGLTVSSELAEEVRRCLRGDGKYNA